MSKPLPSLECESWAYPHVIQTTKQLAEMGNVDLSDPDFLVRASRAQVWSVLDEITRDPDHLHKLTPHIYDVLEAIPEEARPYTQRLEKRLPKLVEPAIAQSDQALRPFGETYAWLSDRSIISRATYQVAVAIEQGSGKTNDLPLTERLRLSEEFISKLKGFGEDPDDAELQAEIAKYELLLGNWWCTQIVAQSAKHGFDPARLTQSGLRKYGIPDLNGINSCYWCGGCPCMCGSRKNAIQRTLRDESMVWRYGMPEMDRMMWSAYGGSRNSAISGLTGPVRAFSEGGGELAFLEQMKEAGGTLSQVREKMGALFLENRNSKAAGEDIESGKKTLDACLYAEAADAAISWPPLVSQAFGLNFTRGVDRSLKHMAKKANVELKTPEDITRTIPKL